MADLPLSFQTAYADLVDRCASAAFDEDFSAPGTFTVKEVRGRRYWYFQQSTAEGRIQKYAGPETPELLQKIRDHKAGRHNWRERQAVVSMLVRSAYLPRPSPEIGRMVEAISKAGVFRLRAVLVGTVAYQTYSATLGTRLSAASMTTNDVDVAQFSNVSIAVADGTPGIVEVLKQTDPSFRALPNLHGSRQTTSYEGAGGVRVDFLTPNEGEDTDVPAELPALGTSAQPLRFLDFLIHDPEPAVLLHGAGIYVLVPAPERYAIHKLIVSRRRREGVAKRDKDVRQAEALLEVLVRKRPHELRAGWAEAFGRGERWRRLIGEGLSLIGSDVRDQVLIAVSQPRSIMPDFDLQFPQTNSRYDDIRDVVTFTGKAGRETVQCAISLEAIEDYFGLTNSDRREVLKKFRAKRSVFENIAREKYLHKAVSEVGSVLVTTADLGTSGMSELLRRKPTIR